MLRKSLKKRSRPWLSLKVVERFQDQTFTSFRRSQPHQRGDDRPVAMAPQDRSLDAQRVKERGRFRRRPPMKIQRHLSRNHRRMPIPRAVGDNYAKFALKSLDLPIEWIDPIAPTAMQKNQRPSSAEFAIVNRDGAYIWGVQRAKELESWHLPLPLAGAKMTNAPYVGFAPPVHALYLTTEFFQTQGAPVEEVTTSHRVPDRRGFVEAFCLRLKTKTAGSGSCQPSPRSARELCLITCVRHRGHHHRRGSRRLHHGSHRLRGNRLRRVRIHR